MEEVVLLAGEVYLVRPNPKKSLEETINDTGIKADPAFSKLFDSKIVSVREPETVEVIILRLGKELDYCQVRFVMSLLSLVPAGLLELLDMVNRYPRAFLSREIVCLGLKVEQTGKQGYPVVAQGGKFLGITLSPKHGTRGSYYYAAKRERGCL